MTPDTGMPQENELVVDELDTLCAAFQKKHDRGGSFRPFRYHRQQQGSNEPVFFVGVPGLSVAVSLTFVILAVVTLASINAPWYGWIPLILLSSALLWFSQKVDTARQVRFLSFSLSGQAIKLLRKACSEDDAVERRKLIEKSSELLDHAASCVAEPSIEEQKKLVDDWLQADQKK